MTKRTKTTFFVRLLSAGLTLIVLQSPLKLAAQHIQKIVVTPSNPLPSDTLKIAIHGDLPSKEIFLADSSMNIISNIIQIRLNFEALGDAGLPILVPSSSSFKVGKLILYKNYSLPKSRRAF